MLTFETRIHRLEWFAHVILISVTPMLQNLRIGLKKRRNGKSEVPAEAAWKLAKSVLKLKEQERATFFSPSENRCLPASTLKPEERKFVVDSGASMHMISKKGLNSAEMETVTHREARRRFLQLMVKCRRMKRQRKMAKNWKNSWLKVLEDTPAVLSLGKLCDEHGNSYEWINGQKTTSH